jgi:RNA polymerase sigma-70 factor (ECF subfamily)
LIALAPSPIVALNRAVAVAKVHGPEQAMREIDGVVDQGALKSYYLLHAVRGRLLRQMGKAADAAANFRSALECPCSEPERKFLQKLLADCEEGA